MVQNCKVVHWPDKQPETAELEWLIRDESIQSSALSYPNRILLLLLTISWFSRRLADAERTKENAVVFDSTLDLLYAAGQEESRGEHRSP
jgi:hypothetical protein